MKEIIEEIKKRINEDCSKDEFIIFNNEKLRIDQGVFEKIPSYDHSLKSVAFIDGGYSEILKGADFLFCIIRVAKLIINQNKTSIHKEEYFALITFLHDKYAIKKYKDNIEHVFIDKKEISDDEIDFSKAGNLLRRITELNTVKNSSEELIILDGSFDYKTQLEKDLINTINKNCIGLSKTSRIITEKGNSISYVLQSIDNSEWIFKINKLFFAKFNKNSDYVFRVDLLNMNKEENKAFSLLSYYSTDPVFLGYPYPLIQVDKIARISDSEKNELTSKAGILLGGNYKEVQKRMNSVNAHDVLDRIG